MKWLVVLVVLLLVASIPATEAWAKGKSREAGSQGDNGKDPCDPCEEKPAPAPLPPPVVASPERDASFVWFVMDRTDPTRRLAGPFYHEQTCKASAAGFNNGMCRAVRG